MPARRGRAVAILAAVAVLEAGSSHAGGAAGSPCQSAPPRAPLVLPAPVIVTTSCGRFRLGPAGAVVYPGARTLPVPRGTSYWADLTWTRFARGHLLVGRRHQRLWRSHRTYPHAYPANIGVVVLGRHELAFSYYRGRRPLLYLARYGAGERALTGGETPLVFLRSGEFVTWRDRGGALVLRTASGRVERLIAPHAANPLVDRHGTILFRVGDRLRVFDGHRVRPLANLRSLGLTGQPLIEPLGRLVAVRDERLLAVLDLDGRRLSSTRLPQRRRRADMVSSPVVANPTGTAVAFAATRGNTLNRSRGRETRLPAPCRRASGAAALQRAAPVQGLRAGRQPGLARPLAPLQHQRRARRSHRHLTTGATGRAEQSDRAATRSTPQQRRRIRRQLGHFALIRCDCGRANSGPHTAERPQHQSMRGERRSHCLPERPRLIWRGDDATAQVAEPSGDAASPRRPRPGSIAPLDLRVSRVLAERALGMTPGLALAGDLHTKRLPKPDSSARRIAPERPRRFVATGRASTSW
jgi:hypothetical protein